MDPNERAWYDSHKNDIVNGGNTEHFEVNF